MSQPITPSSRAGSITLSATTNPDMSISAPVSTEIETTEPINTKDFGIIPIPRRLWHDPENPHPWTLALNIVFGLSSTFSTPLVPFIS